MEDNILHITKNGIEKEILVLKYFKLKTNNKEYIIYKEDVKQLNNVDIYVSEICESNNEFLLKPITDTNILNELNRIIEEMQHE